MEIKIENVLGVRSADFEVNGIALIAGRNGAAKSSLLQTAGALAMQSPMVRGVDKKKEAAAIVREGSERGVGLLSADAGEVKIVWPKCEVSMKGTLNAADPVAMNVTPLSSLPAAKRREYLIGLTGAVPTIDDLALEFKRAGLDGHGAVWKVIQEKGWDEAVNMSNERRIKLKGEWELVTGANWGAKKAQEWAPEGMDRDKPPKREPLEAKLFELSQERDRILTENAITAADVERMKAQVAAVPDARQELAATRTVESELLVEMEKLQDELANLGPTNRDDVIDPPCPHCGKPIRLERRGQILDLIVPPEKVHITDPQLKENRLKHASLDGKMERAKADLNEAQRRAFALEAQIAEAGKIQERLDRMETVGDPDAIRLAEEAVAAVQATLDRLDALDRANDLAARIERNIAIATIISPDGVRAKVATKKLGEFNDRLDKLSRVVLKPGLVVTIGPDFGVWLKSDVIMRPYDLCSESERWRMDAAIAVTILSWNMNLAPFVLLDRLDVVVKDERKPVLKMIYDAGVFAIIGMTAQSVDEVAPLPPAIGTSYWMDEGVLHVI